MTIREILKMGDPRLLRIARPVQNFGAPELHALHRADVAQPVLQLLLLRPHVEQHDADQRRRHRADRQPQDAPPPS